MRFFSWRREQPSQNVRRTPRRSSPLRCTPAGTRRLSLERLETRALLSATGGPGTLDTGAFGSPNGYVTTAFPDPIAKTTVVNPAAMAIAVYPAGTTNAGKIIAAGNQEYALGGAQGTQEDGSFTIARYNADGSLDTSFGSGGKVVTTFHAVGKLVDPGDGSYATQVLIQPDGKILVTGYVQDAYYVDS